jgi:hypothetical protein
MAIGKVHRRIALALLALTVSAVSLAAASLSKEDGDRLQSKIEEIARNGNTSPVAAKKTAISEAEANSYMAFNLKEKIPQGLTQPQVTMLGSGRLAGRVVMDIDEFKRKRKSRGFIDPLNYVSGKVPIAARGALRTQNGEGRFTLGSAEIHGVPLPKPILQELVTYFSRTRDNPQGFDMDKPFNLPAHIREVVINRGEAIVVQ